MKELINNKPYWVFIPKYGYWQILDWIHDGWLMQDGGFEEHNDASFVWEPIEEPDYDPLKLIHNQNLGAGS